MSGLRGVGGRFHDGRPEVDDRSDVEVRSLSLDRSDDDDRPEVEDFSRRSRVGDCSSFRDLLCDDDEPEVEDLLCRSGDGDRSRSRDRLVDDDRSGVEVCSGAGGYPYGV